VLTRQVLLLERRVTRADTSGSIVRVTVVSRADMSGSVAKVTVVTRVDTSVSVGRRA
jgi:hypothetical protein